jgi:hypothetical protein
MPLAPLPAALTSFKDEFRHTVPGPPLPDVTVTPFSEPAEPIVTVLLARVRSSVLVPSVWAKMPVRWAICWTVFRVSSTSRVPPATLDRSMPLPTEAPEFAVAR